MNTDYRGESVYREDDYVGQCFGCGTDPCTCDDADDYGCWYCKSADCSCGTQS